MILHWIDKFYSSIIYYLIIFAVSFWGWYTANEATALLIYLGFATIPVLTNKMTYALIPMLLLFPVLESEQNVLRNLPVSVMSWAIILFLVLIIYQFISKSSTPKLKLLSGFGLFLLALLVSGIPYDASTMIENRAFYMGAGVLFVALYAFFGRTSVWFSRIALARSLFVVGVFVSLQVLLHYAETPDILTAISTRDLELAWGNANSIAIVLLMTIPMSLYLLSERRLLFLMFPFVLLQIATLIFTLSRGSLLSFVIMFPLFMFLLIRESRHRLASVIVLFVAIGITALVFELYPTEMAMIFDRFVRLGFDDSGRFELFAEGISYFLQYPIFGAGFDLPSLDYGSITYLHSTFIQMAAYTGLVGLFALMIHFDQKYALVFKQKNHFFHWVGMVLLVTDLYGLIDVTYFTFIYMVYLGVMLGVADSVSQLTLANDVHSTEVRA